MTIRKLILPESKINGFVKNAVQWDIVIIMSYSTESTFDGTMIHVFIGIEKSEIPVELKNEKLREYYSRYEKTIPNE